MESFIFVSKNTNNGFLQQKHFKFQATKIEFLCLISISIPINLQRMLKNSTLNHVAIFSINSKGKLLISSSKLHSHSSYHLLHASNIKITHEKEKKREQLVSNCQNFVKHISNSFKGHYGQSSSLESNTRIRFLCIQVQ